MPPTPGPGGSNARRTESGTATRKRNTPSGPGFGQLRADIRNHRSNPATQHPCHPTRPAKLLLHLLPRLPSGLGPQVGTLQGRAIRPSTGDGLLQLLSTVVLHMLKRGLGPPGSVQRGRGGKLQANMGRSGTGEGIRPGTPLQVGQSLRPCFVPSRARHQRGRASRTHSWGNRTNKSESSSRSSSKRSVGTSTVLSDRTELKKVNFVAASRPVSPDRPLARSVVQRKILRLTKN